MNGRLLILGALFACVLCPQVLGQTVETRNSKKEAFGSHAYLPLSGGGASGCLTLDVGPIHQSR